MSGYRTTLITQLKLTGPPALAMLEASAPLDGDIFLAAAEAAGLLDETTAGEQAALWQTLRAALVSPPDLSSILQDPRPGTWIGDPDTALEQLAMTAGLAASLPEPWTGRMKAALHTVAIQAELEPDRFAELSSLAGALLDALDLDEDHPITAPLRAVAAAESLAAFSLPAGAIEEGFQAAQRTLFPPLLARWAARIRGQAAELAALLDAAMTAPLIGMAGDRHQQDTPRQRRNLHTRNDQEVNLVVTGGRLVVEWFSESAPPPTAARLEPGGIPLADHAPLEAGTRCWQLGEPPAGPEPIRIVITGPAGSLEVSLDNA